MTELQFPLPTVSAEWADVRNTHIAVATAIHALADERRTAQMIWESPTNEEWAHVTMAVENYIDCDKFYAEDDGRYCWGEEVIQLAEATTVRQLAEGSAAKAMEIAGERAESTDQDWDDESTTYTFADDSKLIVRGPHLEVR